MPPPPSTTQGGSNWDKSEWGLWLWAKTPGYSAKWPQSCASSATFLQSWHIANRAVKMGFIMGGGVGLTIGFIFVSTVFAAAVVRRRGPAAVLGSLGTCAELWEPHGLEGQELTLTGFVLHPSVRTLRLQAPYAQLMTVPAPARAAPWPLLPSTWALRLRRSLSSCPSVR